MPALFVCLPIGTMRAFAQLMAGGARRPKGLPVLSPVY
jgi:hypothetical protein